MVRLCHMLRKPAAAGGLRWRRLRQAFSARRVLGSRLVNHVGGVSEAGRKAAPAAVKLRPSSCVGPAEQHPRAGGSHPPGEPGRRYSGFPGIACRHPASPPSGVAAALRSSRCVRDAASASGVVRLAAARDDSCSKLTSVRPAMHVYRCPAAWARLIFVGRGGDTAFSSPMSGS
jgi:hypothetical protein